MDRGMVYVGETLAALGTIGEVAQRDILAEASRTRVSAAETKNRLGGILRR